MGMGVNMLSVVDDQLGIKEADLWTELRAGKTIAQLAGKKASPPMRLSRQWALPIRQFLTAPLKPAR
jgi:hypothetical protein